LRHLTLLVTFEICLCARIDTAHFSLWSSSPRRGHGSQRDCQAVTAHHHEPDQPPTCPHTVRLGAEQFRHAFPPPDRLRLSTLSRPQHFRDIHRCYFLRRLLAAYPAMPLRGQSVPPETPAPLPRWRPSIFRYVGTPDAGLGVEGVAGLHPRETMPSAPNRQACAKTVGPSSATCSLKIMPASVFRRSPASATLRSRNGRSRRSALSSSTTANAERIAVCAASLRRRSSNRDKPPGPNYRLAIDREALGP
jgi:hypothetical protein